MSFKHKFEEHSQKLHSNDTFEVTNMFMLTSLAISAKRIADALEIIAAKEVLNVDLRPQ